MEKDLPNFPLLFDRIGYFLTKFDKLRKKRPRLSADAFVVELDKLVQPSSPSAAEVALAAFNEIVETMYRASARSCPSGSTRMRD